MPSVLQDWVMELSLRAQGTLLTGIRGCDLAPKHASWSITRHDGGGAAESSPERHLVAFLRHCVLHPADAREVDVPGAWFQSAPPPNWKPSQFGHYPVHWYEHVMHCFEVVGYLHPNDRLRMDANRIYGRLVHNMHLTPETRAQMLERLTEDRIAKGTVVS